MLWGRSRRELALVEQFVAALNAHDVDSVEPLLTEDFVYIDSWREGVRGRDVVMEALRRLLRADPEFELNVERMDWRKPHMLMSGCVNSGQWGKGRRAVWRLTLRDGLICEYQSWAEGGPPPMSRALAPGHVQDMSATAPARPPLDPPD